MGSAKRMGLAVLTGVVFALVMGATWYIVVPAMFGPDGLQPHEVVGGASTMIGEAAEGIDGAMTGLGEAADGLDGVADGLSEAVDGLDEAANELGGAAEDIGEAVSGIMPGAEPVGSAGGPEWGGDAGPADAVDEGGAYYGRDDPGFRETMTHRYVMYPPCAAVLDGMGKEVRTVFGFPTQLPQDSGHRADALNMFDQNYLASQGFTPKPCEFDYNGNWLGDGWEDQNNDGYADGFTDCTKPYVLAEDGWYVRELGRDCKYGAPPARAYEGVDAGSGSVSSSSSSSSTTTGSGSAGSGGSGGSDIPYATAQAGTMTRVIDGDTIVVDGDVRIRLAPVNTPERGEPGYEEASAFTRSKCPVGTTVVYDADDGQRSGSYGRTIAMVWCGGYGSTSSQAAVSLNALLLEAGHAEIDSRFCHASEFGDDEWALRGGC